MTLEHALAATEKLIAIAVALQALEMLSIRQAWSGLGPWRWEIMRPDLPRLLSCFLADRSFRWLLHSQLIACAFILVFAYDFPFIGLFTAWLAFTSLLVSMRWRGSFNGAADSMTIWILTLLTGALWMPELAPLFVKMIASLVVASLFISGSAKLRDKSWRSGTALAQLLQYSNYRESKRLSWWAQSRLTTVLVLLFEVTFPLCLFAKPLAAIYIGIAVVFHIVNYYLFGLNRFLFAWVSAYPAILYFA